MAPPTRHLHIPLPPGSGTPGALATGRRHLFSLKACRLIPDEVMKLARDEQVPLRNFGTDGRERIHPR